MAQDKHVYFFGGDQTDGSAEMRSLLGGKGANLAEMTSLGIPVPPGFTISTEVGKLYHENSNQYPDGLDEQIDENLRKLEAAMDVRFGDTENPLLVSVRSGGCGFYARYDGHHPQPWLERRCGQGTDCKIWE